LISQIYNLNHKILLRSGACRNTLLWLLIFPMVFSACQDQIVNESTNGQAVYSTANKPTEVPPPVIKTISAPDSAISIAPPTPTSVSTDESPPTPTQPVSTIQSGERLAETSTVEVVKPAVPPTFTSPPEPEASPWDHYWFRRPVPDDTALWTDKAYPYGNTRGGLLRPHHGVEFNVPMGTDIYAAASGQIIFAGEDTETIVGPDPGFYGQVLVIQHDFTLEGQPVYSLYGHLSETLLGPGQEVESGELIALSGASGVADGPHLHFETRIGANSYQSTRNPLLWLYPFPERGVVAGNISWPDGQSAAEVPLALRRLDGESPFAATTTYAEASINSDDNWDENFAFDDVAAGYYLLIVGSGEDKTEKELWVYPMQTNYVEIQLGE